MSDHVKVAHIDDFPGFQKIGHFTINSNTSKTLWYFNTCIDSDERKRKGSHIYLIIIDGIVMKLGCSVTSLGNCAGYGVGNAGSPSDRTTGIHYFIANSIRQGKNVAFYTMMCPKVNNVRMKDLFNIDIVEDNVELDPKQQEDRFLKQFMKKYGKLPKWNMQEQGRSADWSNDIKTINRALCNKKKISYDVEHETSPYLMMYHWKYNNIPLTELPSCRVAVTT